MISLDGTAESAKVYINPTVKTAGSLESEQEGCLSLPGIHAKIKRYSKATVTATDLEGNTFTDEADGLYARAIQHENDHLEGMMIKDRMGRASSIAARRHLRKLEEEYEERNS